MFMPAGLHVAPAARNERHLVARLGGCFLFLFFSPTEHGDTTGLSCSLKLASSGGIFPSTCSSTQCISELRRTEALRSWSWRAGEGRDGGNHGLRVWIVVWN